MSRSSSECSFAIHPTAEVHYCFTSSYRNSFPLTPLKEKHGCFGKAGEGMLTLAKVDFNNLKALFKGFSQDSAIWGKRKKKDSFKGDHSWDLGKSC